MRKYVGRNHRSAVHEVDAAASFILLVGLALGAIIAVGIGRIVGLGTCP